MKLVLSDDETTIITIDITDTAVVVECPGIDGYHIDAAAGDPPTVTFDLPATTVATSLEL